MCEKFSRSEIDACVCIAKRMLKLLCLVKINGVVSLWDEVDNEHSLKSGDCDFLKSGINMLLLGAGSVAMEKYFSYSILSGGYKGSSLLEKILISEGLLLIHEPNISISTAADILGAILGEGYANDIKPCADYESIEQVKTIGIHDTVEIIDKCIIPIIGCETFEKEILTLSRLEFIHLLITSNCYDFTASIKGCRKSFMYTIKEKLPEDTFIHICDLLNSIGVLADKAKCAEAQYKMFAAVKELRESGLFSSCPTPL